MNLQTLLTLMVIFNSLSVLIFWLIARRLHSFRKQQIEDGKSIWHLACRTSNIEDGVKKYGERSRNRDENLLRELHRFLGRSDIQYNNSVDFFDDLKERVELLAKLCRGTDNVIRQCANNDTDFMSFFKKIDRHNKEGLRILSLFEETLEKAKKTGRGK